MSMSMGGGGGSSDYAVLKQSAMSEEAVASFVRRLAQQEIEFEDFKQHFTQLNNLKAQTERQLKSKVFTNYTYFIETAKEIKRLDSETKHIGDLLTDQRQMLSELNKALAQVSQSDLFNVKFQSSAANSANSRLNTEVSGLNLPVNDTRTLVSEDVVDEIDLHTNRARQKLCVFMLSDGILTTRFTSQHSAPSRGQQSQGSMYSYAPGTSAKLICVEFYLFNSISIEQTSPSALKAIVYPEPIVLQFGGGKEMKSWIDLFHQAKKRANMNQGALGRRKSSGDTDLHSDITSRLSVDNSATANLSDLFIYDIPAHLDVSTALKDYDACLKYLKQAEDFFEDNKEALMGASGVGSGGSGPMAEASQLGGGHSSHSSIARVKESIDDKRNILISTLRSELFVDASDNDSFGYSDKSSSSRLINMPGAFGKRTGQLKAATALAKLGFTNEACHLFLKATSLNLRRVLQHKLYVSIESLASIAKFVFTSLNLGVKHFREMFSANPSMFSCLSVWACDQVSFFCDQMCHHFNRNNLLLDINKLSGLVQAVMSESSALLEATGMDLSLFLEMGIEPLLKQSTSKMTNFVKQTLQEKSAVESNWDCVHFDGGDDPSECSQSEQQMTTFLKSMDDIGIDLLSLAHSEEEEGGGGGGDSVAVCPISISFFRLLMPICQDMATISRFGNPSLPSNALHDLVGLYIDTLTGRLGSLDEKCDNYDYEKELIMLQLEVFRDYVLKSVTEMFVNFSEGIQLDFDLESVRISEICSTFADSVLPEGQNENTLNAEKQGTSEI